MDADPMMDKAPAAPKDDAARDVLRAIKSNDAKALGLALERHYEVCKDEESAPESTDDYGV